MKITDIKQQVKLKDRYSIFIDGKYSFSLSEGELLAQSLKVGKELTQTELSTAKKDAAIDKAVYRVLNLISRRARSRWEVEDYLKRKNYKPEEISKITRNLEEKGYINDLDFAKRWIENRRLLKSISKRKLCMELKQKRVDDETIQSVLEDDQTDEQQVLKELIEKKRGQTRYQDDQKLTSYLARQGFNYGDIKDALNDKERQ